MKTIALLFLIAMSLGFALGQKFGRDVSQGGATPNDVIENDSAKFLIPTAFSPNSEGLTENDVVEIYGVNVEEIEYFYVYNRRGNLVYEIENILDPKETDADGRRPITTWDGKTTGGKDLPIGVYAYRIKATNGLSEWTGSLKLIR